MPDLYNQLSQLGQTAGSIQTPGYLAQIEGLKTKSALDTAELQRRNIEQSMEQTRLENERIKRQEELQNKYRTELSTVNTQKGRREIAEKYNDIPSANYYFGLEKEETDRSQKEYISAVDSLVKYKEEGLLNKSIYEGLKNKISEIKDVNYEDFTIKKGGAYFNYEDKKHTGVYSAPDENGQRHYAVVLNGTPDLTERGKEETITMPDGKKATATNWGYFTTYKEGKEPLRTNIKIIEMPKGKGMYNIARDILFEETGVEPSVDSIYKRMEELKLKSEEEKQKQKQDIELDKPLKGYEVKNYFDPNTLAPVKGGITMREIEKMGAIKIDTQDRDKLLEIPKTEAIVKELDEVSKELMTATDAASAYSQAIKIKAGRLAKQTLPVGYEAIKSEFIGNLSRSLGGERGVLTDGDIKRIEKGLPADGDTKAIRDFKMLAIYTILQSAKEVERTKVFGLNPNKKEQIKMDTLLKALGSGDETKITNALNSLNINNKEQSKDYKSLWE